MAVEQQIPKVFDVDPSLGHIIGLGVDIIEAERIGRDVEENPLFAEEFCSSEEIAFCDQATGEERRRRYARRFSLKEATIKALGVAGDTGQEPELDWREIILREEGINSAFINLTGRAKKRADELGVTSFSLTFTEVNGVPTIFCLALANRS